MFIKFFYFVNTANLPPDVCHSLEGEGEGEGSGPEFCVRECDDGKVDWTFEQAGEEGGRPDGGGQRAEGQDTASESTGGGIRSECVTLWKKGRRQRRAAFRAAR